MKRTLLCLSLLLGAWSALAARVELKTPCARCVIETLGARVISYATEKRGEILWNDDPVQLADPEWAHGGIPVCWPWFSKDALKRFHGFAWRRVFEVVSRRETAEESAAVFRLSTPEATLTYTVRLTDASLRMSLETRNVSNRPFLFSAALHPYFKVGESTAVTISGVREKPFLVNGKIDGNVPKAKGDPLVFRIDDPSLGRTIVCRGADLNGVCAWNPGPDCPNMPGHIPADAWRYYVCVEPTVGRPDKVSLEPGQTRTFSYEVFPE